MDIHPRISDPAAEVQPACTAPGAVTPRPGRARSRVLFVDDEADQLRALQDLMGDRYDVRTATSGEEALAILSAAEMDVVVSDQRMPGMDGAELLERVREAHPEVIRILLTGCGDQGAVRRAVNEGRIFYYLAKPVTVEELDIVLQKAEQVARLVRERESLMVRLQEANARLTRANEELEERVQERTRDLESFVYTVSHDLQNPLATIAGYAGAARDALRQPDGPAAEAFLGKVETTTERMRDLLRTLLGFARARLAGEGYREEPLDAVLDRVQEDLGSLLASRGARIERDPDLPVLLCRPTLLGQAIENLVANAIQYTPPDRVPAIRISARPVEVATEVRVSDNARGLPCEDWQRVFDLFYSAPGGRASGGTGLGLAICRRAVEAHGGTVIVEASSAEGTTFLLTLPKVPPRAALAPDPQAATV